ncbi:MAG TPA: tRNA (adenosine(37)-N6)-threonylcarbamoyltransferase complex dimerization subunit type 1 TsaB [Thiolinea sp.]|nr:tRNA (adenosine(37)-N6)-threonylcarbamoyltransferase complex dimerization subunit type 1 TsaB [Thiolinea sp.]
MKLLAIDTSTDACSAAVWQDGGIVAEYEVSPRAHTRLILPMVEQVLTRSGTTLKALDGLAFGRGPGAFSGVRIAAGVAQGLALAADLPLIPVSTLAALARQVHQHHGAEKVLVAMDARMGEVYWGAFVIRDGLPEGRGAEVVTAPEAVPWPEGMRDGSAPIFSDWVAVGSGWREYPQLLQKFPQLDAVYPDRLPRAEDLLPLARSALLRNESVDVAVGIPVYLRNKVAETTLEREQRSRLP